MKFGDAELNSKYPTPNALIPMSSLATLVAKSDLTQQITWELPDFISSDAAFRCGTTPDEQHLWIAFPKKQPQVDSTQFFGRF